MMTPERFLGLVLTVLLIVAAVLAIMWLAGRA